MKYKTLALVTPFLLGTTCPEYKVSSFSFSPRSINMCNMPKNMWTKDFRRVSNVWANRKSEEEIDQEKDDYIRIEWVTNDNVTDSGIRELVEEIVRYIQNGLYEAGVYEPLRVTIDLYNKSRMVKPVQITKLISIA